MRRVTVEERRARLAIRHGFVGTQPTVAALADSLVGIHSTDPVSVYVAAAARGTVDEITEMEDALYAERSVLRMLGMRRTLFVVPRRHIATVQRAYTDAFVVRETRRLAGWLETCGVATDGAAHIERMNDLVIETVAGRGEATTRDLTQAHPELDVRFTPPVGGQTGTLSVGSRIVLLLTAGGRLARTRPLGSWISSQYRYARMEDWLGGPISPVDPALARSELARAWLASYGPGTVTDLQWWAGWNKGQTTAALATVGAVEVDLGESTGFVLPDDIEPVRIDRDWAGLLPALDSTPMGWKQRDWYVGSHGRRLFDRNGNIGPTVWWNGVIVGGWGQRSDGSIVIGFLEPVSPACRSAVAAEVDRLQRFVQPTTFTPRFRTPLERELTAG